MESGFSVYVMLPARAGRDSLADSNRRLLAVVPARETAEWLCQAVRADLEMVAEIEACQGSLARPPDPQLTRVYAALGLTRNPAPPAIPTALRALADDHQRAMALAVVFRWLNQPQRGIEPSPTAQTMIAYGRSQVMKLFDLREPLEPARPSPPRAYTARSFALSLPRQEPHQLRRTAIRVDHHHRAAIPRLGAGSPRYPSVPPGFFSPYNTTTRVSPSPRRFDMHLGHRLTDAQDLQAGASMSLTRHLAR